MLGKEKEPDFSSKIILWIPLLIAFFWIWPLSEAYAYIDPQAGNLFMQILLAGIFGVLVFFRQIIDKIQSLFREKKEPVLLTKFPNDERSKKQP